jgi:hypothetical protein
VLAALVVVLRGEPGPDAQGERRFRIEPRQYLAQSRIEQYRGGDGAIFVYPDAAQAQYRDGHGFGVAGPLGETVSQLVPLSGRSQVTAR